MNQKMIQYTQRQGGLTLPVHVTAAAKQNRVGDQHDGALRVQVTAPADKGRANQAVIKELAKALGVRAAQLTLIAGQTHRRKTIAITADDVQSLLVRIATLAEPDVDAT